MKSKNLYEILGLNPDATKGEIKLAYRKLVRIYHPDINKTKEAETYFKLLNNATETLLDDAKRLQYDTMLGFSGHQKSDVQNGAFGKNEKVDFDKTEFNKKSSESLDGQEFKHQKTSEKTSKWSFKGFDIPKKPENSESYINKEAKTAFQSAEMDGKDIETTVFISKTEQKQGTTRKINVLHTDKCPKCAGAKYINGSVCALCRGVGEKSDHKIMNVKIPAGIKNGAKMKIKNEGEYGKFGGKNGDLYLLIQIKEENETLEDKKNIIVEVPIAPWQAVLGDEISVKTGDKIVKIKIPPLTKSRTGFKMEKAGYTVVVKVDIPEKLTKKEIDLYKKLREIARKNDENL